ncbi:MAG TPA: glycoside-pentoside-hexuronide (GPH):cation symporter, partial [Clostridiales bacterium]|nr:glycoside-pentoside-hexuronide (GPH):cation symporter [Clostridiales bacterium]
IFFTQGMGLSLKAWAVIVVLAKTFDAINDPIIGAMVDKRTPGKNGKFRPWIFYSSFTILLTTVLFFADIRALSYGFRFAYTLTMYCLWSIAYTAANVPYGSLNAALTDDISGRTQLSSLRSIGAALAVLPIMIAMPKLIYAPKDPVTGISPIYPERFMWIALVMGLFGMVGFMALYFLTTERLVVKQEKTQYSFMKSLLSFFKNRAAIGISLASFAQLTFFSSAMNTVQYVFQVYFKNTGLIALGNLVMFLPMVVLIPFIPKLTRRFGKREMTAWPMVAGIVIMVLMPFVNFPQNDKGGWLFLVLLGLANMSTGIFLLITWSFVADAVDYQELQTGRREEGTVYAIYSFVRKMAQAASQGMVALLLSAVGFNSENVAQTTPEAAAGVLRVSIYLPLVGIVLMFVAMQFVYHLDKQGTINMSETLRAKRAKQESQ